MLERRVVDVFSQVDDFFNCKTIALHEKYK